MSDDDAARPIDRMRNSAFSIKLGEEGGNIVETYKIGEERMLLIRESSVTEIQLADQVDPSRLNPKVPHVKQSVMSVGATDELVQKTLLTAKVLFGDKMLGGAFEYEKAFELALELARDVFSMRQIADKLNADEESEIAKFRSQEHITGQMQLPCIPDIKARCDDFSIKANHAAKNIRALIELFYDPLPKKWVDSFARIVAERHGAESDLADFMKTAAPFLLFTINFRNSAEHRSATMNMIARDYKMNADAEIVGPTIEVIHPDTPHPETDAQMFMKIMTENMLFAVEWMMGHLCAANVKPFGAMQIIVTEVPEGRRRHGVQFGYFGNIQGRWTPFG